MVGRYLKGAPVDLTGKGLAAVAAPGYSVTAWVKLMQARLADARRVIYRQAAT